MKRLAAAWKAGPRGSIAAGSAAWNIGGGIDLVGIVRIATVVAKIRTCWRNIVK
jgi:hypothetical protein